MTARKLTVAQARVLRLLSRGYRPTEGLKGRSEHGGFFRTWGSLVRAGLVHKTNAGKTYPEWLTDAGRAALTAEDGE